MLGLIKLFRSSKDDSPPPVLSIIGDDTTIRGDTIEGTGDLRIEDTIRADALTIESRAAFKGVVHDEDGVPSSLAVSSGDHLPAPVDAVEDSGAISRKHGQ